MSTADASFSREHFERPTFALPMSECNHDIVVYKCIHMFVLQAPEQLQKMFTTGYMAPGAML